MAVAPTGAMFKSLSFDNTTSRNYGVYITGQAVYNAPERDVEMITMPGRNGAFALDNGRFENITVTYPAGIFADNETDFAEAISDFRNFLCSKKGYCRLTDDYNPTEYRMAIYKSGLEVSPAQLKAGEFEIIFECKPQRYLTSGETKQTIANSGDAITNPTLFDAGPLLEVTGYGDITINDSTVTVDDAAVNFIQLTAQKSDNALAYSSPTYYIRYFNAYNAGDTIRVEYFKNTIRLEAKSGKELVSLERTSESGTDTLLVESIDTSELPTAITLTYTERDRTFSALRATGSELYTYTASYTLSWKNTGSDTIQTSSYSVEFRAGNTFSYGDAAISMGIHDITYSTAAVNVTWSYYVQNVYIESTKGSLFPIYIDLDIGEAYAIAGTGTVDLNNIVSLPPNMPTLSPGNNEITFDNTVTKLEITPRWWKV